MDLLSELGEMVSGSRSGLEARQSQLRRSRNKVKQEQNRCTNLEADILEHEARLEFLPLFEAVVLAKRSQNVTAMVAPQLVWVDMSNTTIDGPAFTVLPRNPNEQRLPSSRTVVDMIDDDEEEDDD